MDTRSRFRKRKDDALLRAWARHEYAKVRAQKAKEEGVPVEMMRIAKGRNEAITEAYRKLRGWFNGLPAPQRNQARDQLREQLGGEE